MPTYEYVCRKCEHRFERFQSITAKPVRKCPNCGKSGVQRLVSAGAGIIFKGSGFYATDYRSDSYKSAAKADSSSTTTKTPEKGQETKSEAKPQTEAAAKESKKKTA